MHEHIKSLASAIKVQAETVACLSSIRGPLMAVAAAPKKLSDGKGRDKAAGGRWDMIVQDSKRVGNYSVEALVI
jgi:hypothetical protein